MHKHIRGANRSKHNPAFRLGTSHFSDRAAQPNPIRLYLVPNMLAKTQRYRAQNNQLPGLELDETLGANLVQDAETALTTPDGVGALDDVAGTAISAPVLDAAEGGDGDGGGTGGGGGCWFGHAYCLLLNGYARRCRQGGLYVCVRGFGLLERVVLAASCFYAFCFVSGSWLMAVDRRCVGS